jgi:DNA modification methylase
VTATWRLLTGDARERLAELPAESVHCVVTSPPYFRLRDYRIAAPELADHGLNHAGHHGNGARPRRKIGWSPTCAHEHASARCVVLDPFAGAGTTLLVALRLGRCAIGVELGPEYVELARRRIHDCPLHNHAGEIDVMPAPSTVGEGAR